MNSKPIKILFMIILFSFIWAAVRSADADENQIPVYDEWPFDAEEAQRRQQETAERLGIPVEKTIDLGEGVEIHLVLIPAGEFMMGSPEDERQRHHNEGPQHRVRISRPFYMGKHEVTQAQWERVMDFNPSYFKGENLPVEQVSWNECLKFLQKAGNGLRLPTEAEWEYACRAGTSTRFHCGDALRARELTPFAWLGDNSESRSREVGGLEPNPWGLYDMHGNVWEWCADGLRKYEEGMETDPIGADEEDDFKAIRGGGWFSLNFALRSALRYSQKPDYRAADGGFRVVYPVSDAE